MIDRRTLLTAAVPYGFVLALLYLKGFWDSFDVNALEYASLNDIVGAAIFPLALVILGTPVVGLMGALVGARLRDVHLARSDYDWPETAAEGESQEVKDPPNVRNGKIIAVIAVFAAPFVYLLVPAPTKWAFIAMLVGLAFVPLINFKPFEQAVPADFSRLALILLISCMPFLAYHRGQEHASRAIGDTTARVVDVARSAMPVTTTAPVFYLGRLGSTSFLYERSSRSVLLTPSDAPLIFTPKYEQNPVVSF